MPYIRIIDGLEQNYQIVSSDYETIARWLVETLTKCTNASAYNNDVRVIIRPRWVGPEIGGGWDWGPALNNTFDVLLKGCTLGENMRALADEMFAYAKKIEEGL